MTDSLRAALLSWYRANARDLPWRRTRDPYRVWLSEAMCQQTRVDTAIPYYERFIARWPTLADLAAAEEDDVLRAWAGLGYYARARALHATARACVERHGGRVPSSEAELRALRGIGPYTAGAVGSIAFGLRLAAVDGNAVRVLSRLFRVEASDPRPEVERRAAELVPAEAPGEWNQAVMELGASLCSPRAPRCDACPVASLCAAREAGIAAELPRRAPKREVAEVAVAVAVVRRGAETLLVKRPAKGLLAGMWAPPAVEVEASGLRPQASGMAFERALERAFPVRARRVLAQWTHKFTHRTWRCTACECALQGEVEGARWAGDLDGIPTAFRPAFINPEA